MPAPDLKGQQILVTRPAGQGDRLSELIQDHGGQARQVPLLTITPLVTDHAQVEAQLQQASIVIFISANAVQHARSLLTSLAADTRVAAVGEATARALESAGVPVQLVPERFDSEALLALPALQSLAGQHVLIVRGAGGREKLASELRARGAQVTYLEVYRRDCPIWSAAELGSALAADIITVTSGEALENLAQLAQAHQAVALFAKQLAVFHARIASRAAELGFKLKPLIAQQASDEGLLASILDWHQQQGV